MNDMKFQRTVTYELTQEQLAEILVDYFKEHDAKDKKLKFNITEEKDYRGDSMGRKVNTVTLELKTDA